MPNKPEFIKKGDVIQIADNAFKLRPAVVWRVHEEIVYVIPITHDNDCPLKIHTAHSRFFGDSHFTNYFIGVPERVAIQHFIGVYDNPKELNRVVFKIQSLHKKLFLKH